MSVCKEGSIYWKMLEDARAIISKYWDCKETDVEDFVNETTAWRNEYCIDTFIKKYPNVNEKQRHNMDVLELWAYHLMMAMMNAVDDVSAGRFRKEWNK